MEQHLQNVKLNLKLNFIYKFKRLHLHIKDQNTNRRRKLKPGNNLFIFTTIPETFGIFSG